MPRSKSKFAKLTRNERAELVRLRRENKQLRAEREILGEAAAWFAKAAVPATKRSSHS